MKELMVQVKDINFGLTVSPEFKARQLISSQIKFNCPGTTTLKPSTAYLLLQWGTILSPMLNGNEKWLNPVK